MRVDASKKVLTIILKICHVQLFRYESTGLIKYGNENGTISTVHAITIYLPSYIRDIPKYVHVLNYSILFIYLRCAQPKIEL